MRAGTTMRIMDHGRSSCLARLMLTILLISLFSVLLPNQATAFYLPGFNPMPHEAGSNLTVKVNSLTSVNTGLPFNYYDLPFCKPYKVIKEDENFGERLYGDLIETSPYVFQMKVNKKAVKVCNSNPLTKEDVENFNDKISDKYHINMLLDNLPVTYFSQIEEDLGDILRGFPVGTLVKKSDNEIQSYVTNHLQFKVLYHEYKEPAVFTGMSVGETAVDVVEKNPASNTSQWLVVGFEVQPCSIYRIADDKVPPGAQLSEVQCSKNLNTWQPVKVGAKIVYTYDITWELSDITWATRWDAYLKMRGDQVHWFSILNSLMVISFLAGMVFVILLRSVHRDLARIEQMDKEEAAQMADESGWKLVVGDVFRAPSLPGLLCVVVGSGVQIVLMSAVTIFFAALGFMSPASRGALLVGIVVLYLMLGISAGYVAARLWVLMTGLPEGTVSLAMKVACFFPGITSIVLLILNAMLWSSGSTGALPFVVFLKIFAMWIVISVPLTITGTHFGMKAPRIPYPVRTNQIPRQIPEQRYPRWLLILGGGILPFGTLYIELYFIMSSIWMQRVYYGFGFLFIVLILLILVCAEVAVVFTYLQLTMEDYRWWWRSFLASGSVAFYAALYSVNYLFVNLNPMSGTWHEILFIGYSALMVFGIFLATGSIGFLASGYFVYYLFSSVKLD